MSHLLPSTFPRSAAATPLKWMMLSAGALVWDAASAIDGLPHDYNPIEEGHVDFSFCYADGEWDMGMIHEVGGDPNDPAAGSRKPGELGPMISKDQLFPNGSRRIRAAEADWDFLGVPAGAPYWFFPDTSTALVYPGFNVCDIEEAASYFEDDPRINAEGRWVTVTLRHVDYRGKHPQGGKYSMWTTDGFGSTTVWMTQTDGITDNDAYIILAGSHAHPNMAFSALGLYAVTFDLTFYRGPGKTNPETSPMATYFFAVGTYWEWVARRFDPTRWYVDGYVDENDDPDGDGLTNAVEYAFDLDPTVPDRDKFAVATGKGLPRVVTENDGGELVLRFPRRVAESYPQLQTSIEISPTAKPGSWSVSGGTTALSALRPDWETVTHRLPIGAEDRRFIRVRAELQTEIAY